MSDNQEMLSVLFGLTEEQLKNIQEQITKFDEQNKALKAGNRELVNAVAQIQQDVKKSVQTLIQAEVSSITKSAREEIKNSIAESLQGAKETTDKLNESLSFFGYRWLMLWAFGLVTGVAFFYGLYTFYDYKLSTLVSVKYDYEQSIENLKLLNKGEIILNKCDDKPCVKVKEKERYTNKKGDVLYVIDK